MKELEDVPEAEKDWHPRSSGLVLDLVHPSLYPLVYGRSLTSNLDMPPAASQSEPQAGSPVAAAPLVTVDAPSSPSHITSGSFAWLPTDFSVGASGVTAKAYINNVHPSHKELVRVIERAVHAFVPMFERVLTDLLPENFNIAPRIEKSDSYRVYGVAPSPPSPKWDLADDNDYEARHKDWYENHRVIIQPDPKQSRISIEERKAEYSLRGRDIQVIVKFANIILVRQFHTENPSSISHAIIHLDT